MFNNEQKVSEKMKGDLVLLNHRLLHFGMTYGDLMRTEQKPPLFGPWSIEVAQMAENYEVKGNQAWLENKRTTAIHNWRLASTYYHFAQLFLMSKDPHKAEYRINSRRAFSKLAHLITPKAESIRVAFETTFLPGYLRVAKTGAPCVIFINGLDSSKEVELFFMSEYFLERGISVFIFDGPGQGEVLNILSMTRDNFERAVSAAICSLSGHPDIDVEKIGVFGVSFGGYLAPRAAAYDQRIKACISLCGPYDYRLEYCPPVVIDGFMDQFAVEKALDMSAFQGLISLEDIKGKLTVPTFIVIGEKDHLMNDCQKDSMEKLPSGDKIVLRVADGEHVCSSRHSEILPILADWMSSQL